MKKYKYLLILLFVGLFFVTSTLNAQVGPGNPPGDPAEGGGGPIGGNAPVDAGITILLTLGAAYGVGKTYRYLKNNKE